jgi:hypothetical protein
MQNLAKLFERFRHITLDSISNKILKEMGEWSSWGGSKESVLKRYLEMYMEREPEYDRPTLLKSAAFIFEMPINQVSDILQELEVKVHASVDESLEDDAKNDKRPDDKYDGEQLSLGIKIEKEHTSNEEVAKKIAKDHLDEDPEYYTKLKKMETGCCDKGCKESTTSKAYQALILLEGSDTGDEKRINIFAVSEENAIKKIQEKFGKHTEIKFLDLQKKECRTDDLLTSLREKVEFDGKYYGDSTDNVDEGSDDEKLDAKETVVKKEVQKESKKIKESVSELIDEGPELSKDDKIILRWALSHNKISNSFPSYSAMMIMLSKLEGAVKIDPATVDWNKTADTADVAAMYLKYILLPKAKKAYSEERNVKVESKLLYICNECCKTFRNTKKVCTVCGKSECVEKIVNEEGGGHKDPDNTYDESDNPSSGWRGPELHTFIVKYRNNDTNEIKTFKVKAGDKNYARTLALNMLKNDYGDDINLIEILRIKEIEESKLNEEEDKLTVIARGIVDKDQAAKVATDKKGQVVPDDKDGTKFMVVVKEGKIKEGLFDNFYDADVDVEVTVEGLQEGEKVSSTSFKAALKYEIQFEHRSWGIKGFTIVPTSLSEFDVEVIKTNDEGYEEPTTTIPVKVDFSALQYSINWVEGSGIRVDTISIVVSRDGKVEDATLDCIAGN